MSGVKPLSDENLVRILTRYVNKGSVTLDDIKSPQTPFIVNVLDSVLSEFHLNLENTYTQPWNAYEILEYLELYEDILPLGSLTVLVNNIMQYCGISDFSVIDILEPKCKRTKKILNYLIALCKFVATKYQLLQKIEDEYKTELSRKEKLANEIDLMTQRINELTLHLEKMCPEVDELQNLKSEIFEKLNHMEQCKDMVNKEYQKSKSNRADLRKNLNDINVAIASHKERLEELNQIIVKSPDRIAAEDEQLKQKISEMDKRAKDISIKYTEKRKQSELNQQIYDQLITVVDNTREFFSDAEQFRDWCCTSEAWQTKLKNEEDHLKMQNWELEQNEEHKFLCEDRAVKENLKNKKKITAVQEVNAMNQKDLARANSLFDFITKCETDYQKQLQTEIAAIEHGKKLHEITVQNVTKEYELIKKDFENYYQDYIEDLDEYLKTVEVLDKSLE